MNYKLKKQLHEDVTNNSFEEKVAYAKQQLQNGARPKDVFDFIGISEDGFTAVMLDRKWNLIDPDGNLLSDLWFDFIDNDWYYHDGFAFARINGKNGENGKIYYLDKKGNLYDEDKNPIENVTENKRRVVRLTESQLRKTIERVVTQCLNERKRR